MRRSDLLAKIGVAGSIPRRVLSLLESFSRTSRIMRLLLEHPPNLHLHEAGLIHVIELQHSSRGVGKGLVADESESEG
jgi:hypothetical protein